jgi:23S rRNA (guanine745-N1)-methyltransferase
VRADVIGLLQCPHCGGGLSQAGAALRCARGHSFDVARQGYVNLLPGDAHTGTADSAAMVGARDAFLSAGHFAGLRDAIAKVAAGVMPAGLGDATDGGPRLLPADRGHPPGDGGGGCVVDVGAGTGYYLAAILDWLPDRVGLALDLSKFALRRAARAHERIGAVACDTWQGLPLRDGCAALVLDIFAPRNPAEFRRVLEAAGRLIVVTPTQSHLRELVPALGLLTVDERKQERMDQKFAADFAFVASTVYEESLALIPDEIVTLVGMGPNAHHVQSDELARRVTGLAGPPPGAEPSPKAGCPPETAPESVREFPLQFAVSVTLSVLISVYRPL